MGKKKRRTKAPARIHYGSAKNTDGDKQLCVWAICELSSNCFGPVWGHGQQSVTRALASLTKVCDCPAKFHNAREFSGKRIKTKPKTPRR